jgi:hypothetical protein
MTEALSHRDFEHATETPAPPAAPPVVTSEPVAVTPEPDEHAETPSEAENRERDESGRFRGRRHRASSQQASPEDVPRIRELTRKLRETEQTLEQERQARPAPPRVAQTTGELPAAFTDAEPMLEQFVNESDPYAAWMRAMTRWDRKKETFESAQTEAKASVARTTQAAREAAERDVDTAYQAHVTRLTAFTKTHPDVTDLLAQATQQTHPMNPLLGQALITHDKSAELVYLLAQQPDLHAELFLQSHGRDATPEAVAALRRVLTTRVLAVPTRSAAATMTEAPPPKPPNLVRTGTMKAGDEPPAADDFDAHAGYWGKKREGGRRR